MSVKRAERDLARAKEDVDRLRLQLAQAEQRRVKIEYYLEMAQIYEADGADDFPTESAKGDPPKTVQAVIELLREVRHPIATKTLVTELAKRGIQIGGTNPTTNLAGSFSTWKGSLRASRKDGWSLMEWGEDQISDRANMAVGIFDGDRIPSWMADAPEPMAADYEGPEREVEDETPE